jgi:hypothetical protein
MIKLILIGILSAIAATAGLGYNNNAPEWVRKSNEAAQPMLDFMAKYSPESASEEGIEEADERVIDLKPDRYERRRADGQKIIRDLQAKKETESDPKVRRDLELLIAAQKDGLETDRLNRELRLPFYDVGLLVFDGLHALLDPRNSPDRQAKARTRLNRYAGQEPGFEPIIELAKARTLEMLGNPALVRPYVEEVNEAISNTQIYLDGIAELFRNAKQSWTLTAHEARPGHDLQFTSMVDNGVSIARSIFADNSANVEGWAVYMESVMEPYEPLEGQLFSLDDRLLRIARAFLDPMLNLGLMRPEQAKAFLINEVALSESDATEEVNRYTFRAGENLGGPEFCFCRTPTEPDLSGGPVFL